MTIKTVKIEDVVELEGLSIPSKPQKDKKKVLVLNSQKAITVSKATHLIQARYRLSLAEQKVVLCIISMMQNKLINSKYQTIAEAQQTLYRVPAKTLLDALNLKTDSGYTELQAVTRRLRNKGLDLQMSEDPNDIKQTGWFESVRYYSKLGYIDFSVDEDLLPYLLELKNRYTSYQIEEVIHLKSQYSIRLYELLINLKGCANPSKIYSVEELRLKLGFTGEDAHKYEEFGMFKARVLAQALKEFETTDIAVTIIAIKTLRKVTHVKFTVIATKEDKKISVKGKNKKEAPKDDAQEISPEMQLVIERLRGNLVPENKIKEFILNPDFSADYLSEKLDLADKKQGKGEINENLIGFIISAIEKNFKNEKGTTGSNSKISKKASSGWFIEKSEAEKDGFVWGRDEIKRTAEEIKKEKEEDYIKLSALQSLRAFMTGDEFTIAMERKAELKAEIYNFVESFENSNNYKKIVTEYIKKFKSNEITVTVYK